MSPPNPVMLPLSVRRAAFAHPGPTIARVGDRRSSAVSPQSRPTHGTLPAVIAYSVAVSEPPMTGEQVGLESSADGENRREHVLIVDDERDIRESLQALIEAEFPEVRVQAVDSGPAALEVMRQGHVDVVISDYRMPEMNGLELLDRIQAMAPTARLGLISAYNDPKMGNHTSFPQLSFFLSKPIEVGAFVAHTKRLLKGS